MAKNMLVGNGWIEARPVELNDLVSPDPLLARPLIFRAGLHGLRFGPRQIANSCVASPRTSTPDALSIDLSRPSSLRGSSKPFRL